jgi:hypothetical protein
MGNGLGCFAGFAATVAVAGVIIYAPVVDWFKVYDDCGLSSAARLGLQHFRLADG